MMKNEYIRMGSVVAKEKMSKETAWEKSEKALLEAARLSNVRDYGDTVDPGAGLVLNQPTLKLKRICETCLNFYFFHLCFGEPNDGE